MKVNDIVVLDFKDKKIRNNDFLILESEKHLFEITLQVNDEVRLQSLSTGFSIDVHKTNYRLATLKEKYLRDGNVVELENGDVYVVMIGGIIGEYSHDILEGYDNNMFHKKYKEFDIIKVYKHINPLHDYIYNSFKMLLDNDNNKLLWERNPKIELTIDEKVILRNLDNDRCKYIMRNEYGGLKVSGHKRGAGYVFHLNAYNHLFKSITQESGIHEIKELLK